MQARFLIADDDRDVLAALRLALKPHQIEVIPATSPAAALAVAAAEQIDAAIIDLNYARDTTSGTEGLELLTKLRLLDRYMPIVVMTAWGSVGLAVEAMRAGAHDFIEKPWESSRLLNVVRNQLELSQALRRSRRLEAENSLLRTAHCPQLIAVSKEMVEVLALTQRVADSDAAILITGENGTGKSLLARLIHAASERRDGPFIEVNIGALSESVFESEMFGHVRGAFTDAREERAGRIELADGGTIFLDEIGNLPLSQQAKLLRVLDVGEFEPVGSSRTRKANVRSICATNANPRKLIEEQRFREDLLFRINTVEIHMPALRDRREDIMPLALAALESSAKRYGRPLRAFEPAAVQALEGYSWPGNVRELNHVIERAVLLAADESINARDLRLESAQVVPTLEDMSLEDAERSLIRAALKRCDGNASAAAGALGLSRSALYRRLEKLGISTDD